MRLKTYVYIAFWSTVSGGWISSSLISFVKEKSVFVNLISKDKKCWYDGSKSFKEELIEVSEKFRKLEEKIENTVSEEENNDSPYEKLKSFINDEIQSYCKKRFDTLMVKLEEVFENGERYQDYYEIYNDTFNEVLFKLDPLWNKYNDENYDEILKWSDSNEGILKTDSGETSLR